MRGKVGKSEMDAFNGPTHSALQHMSNSPVRCYQWILKPFHHQHKTLKLSLPLLQPCYLYSEDAQMITLVWVL